jgi:hypothetical protein
MQLIAFAAAAITASATLATGQIITQWNFNGASATTVPGGTASPTPSTGAGIASLIGGATSPSFNSGVGSSDPILTAPTNYGWQTTTYAAQGQTPNTRGVRFDVSTLGFTNIVITFDTRHSNTSSAWVALDWSADGGATWTNAGAFQANAGDTWFNGRTSGVLPAAASNNASFAFRMTTIFAPGAAAYVASNPASTYATTGTLRWDMVTVTGIPTPGSIALLGVAGLIAARRRR